ncbi:MAG: DUF87 domain-containing protein [Alphaproteobacteria bacterium]|nr:DUF87 domain-containing protein [Alphaproteobacteria bacterium]
MGKKQKFLPESISSMLHNLGMRVFGILFFVLSLWLIITLFVYNPYYSGFLTDSSFGEQNIIENIVGFIRYVIGFVPSLFIFMCLGRFGLSILIGWEEEHAPEYNFLRGFITLCIGTAGLGLINIDNTYGGLFGTIVSTDLYKIIPGFCMPMGIVLIVLFCLMSCVLLHIKWHHVQFAIRNVYHLIRVVLSAFHLLPQQEVEEEYIEDEEDTEDEEQEELEEEKPKRKIKRKPKENRETEQIEYELPSPELLEKSVFGKNVVTQEFKQTAVLLKDHFEEFGVSGNIVGIKPGPIVTRYEFELERGTRMSKVSETSEDMTRVMATENIRISHVVGTPYMGVEMVNLHRQAVRYQTLMSNPAFVNSKMAIPLALGVNISGEPMYYDLAKMPHVMIAGRTGSGKSVFVQSIIMSIVYHFTPDKCKLVIVDPKGVDFPPWNGIPHLITPVVKDAVEAVNALKWSVGDMENRYKKLQRLGVRDIGEYNEKVAALRAKGEVLTEQIVVGTDPETGELQYDTQTVDLSDMSYLVIVIDEAADLMNVARKDVEWCVQRLAQKARAAGIHLVMATQRPSADVITGVIKANFPTRISFQARSNIDSMTTLGEKGAEQLLSCGDMLFSESGKRPIRIHGALIENKEVNRVADFLRSQGEAEYAEGITSGEDFLTGQTAGMGGMSASKASQNNDLYEQAKEIVLRDKKPTISYLQRRLQIGYIKAATLIETMEQNGVISAPDATGKRHIL